jgi:hypothetical protein
MTMEEGNKRPLEPATPTPEERQLENKKVDNKTTPDKTSNQAIRALQTNLATKKGQPKYGSAAWCAALHRCNIKTNQARGDQVCNECHREVHSECTMVISAESATEKQIVLCFPCYDESIPSGAGVDDSFTEAIDNHSVSTADRNAMDTSAITHEGLNDDADTSNDSNMRIGWKFPDDDRDFRIRNY